MSSFDVLIHLRWLVKNSVTIEPSSSPKVSKKNESAKESSFSNGRSCNISLNYNIGGGSQGSGSVSEACESGRSFGLSVMFLEPFLIVFMSAVLVGCMCVCACVRGQGNN